MALSVFVHIYSIVFIRVVPSDDEKGPPPMYKNNSTPAEKEYYRNTCPIGDIDEGGLWEREGDKMVLVDEDEFVIVKFADNNFLIEVGMKNVKICSKTCG